MKWLISSLSLIFISLTAISQNFEFENEAKLTDTSSLPYSFSEIVVRGFDASNPPPTRITTSRPMLFGYGITAYLSNNDSLIYFKILSADAVHRDKKGNEIKRFQIQGGKYPAAFKEYFLNEISKDEWKNIWFEDVFIKDKTEHFLHITEPQKFCPHCL